jgi:transcriptional/translational regulatory protein YebC/TACO1
MLHRVERVPFLESLHRVIFPASSSQRLTRYSYDSTLCASPRNHALSHADVLCTGVSHRRLFSSSFVHLAGHNKWSKIAKGKMGKDASRANLAGKISASISAAVRASGADPDSNTALANAIDKAKANNISRDIVDRAIAAAKSGEGVEAATFEGMGPGGVAILVETLTSNKKRSSISLRYIWNKAGCETGFGNPVSFIFERKGRLLVSYDPTCTSEDSILESAMNADALDVDFKGTSLAEGDEGEDAEEAVSRKKVASPKLERVVIWADPDRVQSVRKRLAEAGAGPVLTIERTQVIRQPSSFVKIPTEAEEEAFSLFLETLEELPEVQDVWHNAEE